MECTIKKNIKSTILIDTKSAKDYMKLMEYLKSKDFFNEKTDYSILTFKFCLPYLFHIEEKTYEINLNSEIAKLNFTKKHTDKVKLKKDDKPYLTTKANSPEIAELVNGELVHDSTGQFWYTEVDIEIPFTKKELEFYNDKKENPQDAIRTCILVSKLFLYINRFITCYRNSIFEPQIKELTPVDLRLIYLDKGDQYHTIMFTEQLPLIDYRNSDKSYGIDKPKIEDFIKRLKSDKPLPVWVDLMNNVHLYYIKNDYRMSVIECYIVLESYIKEIIDEFLPKKMNNNLFKKFYNEKKERLSIVDLYDQFAELCLGFSFKQTHTQLWDKFNKFRKLRNDAVHNKLVSIEEREAHECMKNTQEIINVLQKKRYEKEDKFK